MNNRARLLPMAEFVYNNAINANTGHTAFELNSGYHPCIFLHNEIRSYSRSCSVNELE